MEGQKSFPEFPRVKLKELSKFPSKYYEILFQSFGVFRKEIENS